MKVIVIPISKLAHDHIYLTEEMIRFGHTTYIQVNKKHKLLLGTLHEGKITLEDARYLGGKLRKEIDRLSFAKVELDIEDLQTGTIVFDKGLLQAFITGWYLAGYRFTKYQTSKAKAEAKLNLRGIDQEIITQAKVEADAIILARDLCNEPANKLTPEIYANRIKTVFEDTKVDVKVINEADLQAEGFIATEIVGKGSANETKLAILNYKNSSNDPIGLVGKGVTFDSGGTNVKTMSDIGEMKMDMGGSAAVVGALKFISDLNLQTSIIAVIPLVTNLSDGASFLPSDIITYANNFHVEVGNTDAEGRLVLADGLLYTQAKGAKTVIDIATLTGTIGQALGLKMAGIFSNKEEDLWRYKEIGEQTGDHVWPMPLVDDYKTYIKSDSADLNNMSSNPFGGAITAAVFLKQFIEEDHHWIHIDMANTVRHWKKDGYYTEGAAGFGVRLLTELVKEYS